MGKRGRAAAIEQVADVEALADVVPANVGVVEDLLAVAVGEDSALADHVAAVGDFERFSELVVGQEDADVVLFDQGADLVLDLGDGLGVDAGERLVEHDHLGLGDQRPRDFSRRRSPPETRLALVLRILVRPNWSSSSFWRSLSLLPAQSACGFRRMAIRLSSTESWRKTLVSCAR